MLASHGLAPSSRRRHKLRNRLQTGALLLGMGGFVAFSAWAIAGIEGVAWAILGGAIGVLLGPRLSPELLMRVSGARPIGRGELAAVYRVLDRMSRRAGLDATPRLFHLPDDVPNAFAVGRRDAAAIALTDAMFRLLSLRELAAVLAHELSHIRNGDLWVMQVADAMSHLTRLMALAGAAVAVVAFPFMLVADVPFPGLLVVLLIAAPVAANLLQLALSRTREYDADLDAAGLTGDPAGLVSALRRIERVAGGPWREVFLPRPRRPAPSLLRSHPPTAERIERLLALAPGAGMAADDPPAPLPARVARPPRRRFRW